MKKKIFLFVVVAFLVVVLAAVLVADMKFGALRAAPQISSMSLIKPETRGVILFNPPLAQKLIKQQVLNLNPKIPTWAVDATLPHQAAIIFDVDYAISKLNGTIFINERRLGPVIKDQINNIAIKEPFSKVITEEMKQEKRGMLTRNAVWSLDRDIMSKLRWQWRNIKVDSPLKPEGNHMLEVVLDNRDGGALVVLATLYPMLFGTSVDSFMTSSAQDIAMAYSAIKLHADLADNNELKVHLAIECSPVADSGVTGFIPEYYELLRKTLEKQLERFGITVTADVKEPVNGVYPIDFTFSNADQLLSPNVLGAFIQM